MSYLNALLPPAWEVFLPLTILLLLTWKMRFVRGVALNLLSFLVGASLSITVASGLAHLVTSMLAYRGLDAAFAVTFVRTLFAVLGGAIFLSGVGNDAIDSAKAAVLEFGGFQLGLQVHTGTYWWPRIHKIGELVLFWRSAQLSTDTKPTRQIQTKAVAPDHNEMVVFASLEVNVEDVQKALKKAPSDAQAEEILLFALDGINREVVQDEHLFGSSSTELSKNSQHIRAFAERFLQLDEGNDIGRHVKVHIRQMLPPKEVLEAAAKKTAQYELAIARKLDADGLTAAVKKFAADNGFTTAYALAVLQVEGGKANKLIFTPEGIDELYALIRQGIERIVTARAAA
jgi:hypothetical protein